MNTVRLQQRVDRLLATSRQRWLVALCTVLAAPITSTAMSIASDADDTWVVALVVVLAAVAMMQPDSHVALAVVAVVVLQFLALDAGVTSPWSLAVAGQILVVHTLVALTAATPHDTTVDRAVLLRWLARSGVVAAWTCAVWLLVVAFERRHASGNVVVSVAAFTALAGAIILFRALSSPHPRGQPGR